MSEPPDRDPTESNGFYGFFARIRTSHILSWLRSVTDDGSPISLSELFFALAWVALSAVYVWPIVSNEFLPAMDSPSHLALVNVWRHIHDGGIISAYYETRPSAALVQPYDTHYFAVRALGSVMSIELANRVVMGLYALGLPASLAYLLTRFGKDKRYALLSFPLIYNRAFGYGFLANSLALPILLLTLGALKSYLDRPSVTRELLVAGLLLLLFGTHLLVFASFAVVGPVIFFSHVHHPKNIVRRSLFVWPSFAVALQWAMSTMAENQDGPIKGEFLSITSNIQQFFSWSTNVLVKESDEIVLLAVILTWLALLMVPSNGSEKANKSWSLPLAGLALLLAYFAMPTNMIRPDHWATNARWVVPAFLLLLSLPRARLDNHYSWLLVPAVGVMIWSGLRMGDAFRKFNEQMAPLDEVLRFIPPNQRVLTLTYDENDGIFDTHSLRSQLLLYQVRKGGATPYGYMGRNHYPFPVRLRATMPAPSWRYPGNFRYPMYGKFYDYFLVLDRQNTKPKASFPGAGNHVQLLVKRGRFSAYNNLK